MNGYIALHRKLFDNPVVCKDADHLAIWIWLLCHAVWQPTDIMFHGERITLQAGQLTTGRRVIASELKISESKVQRVLKCFESEQQIEQRTDRQCRLITIVSWADYQDTEQRNEQRVNNEWTTSEQRVNTNKEYKNIRIKENIDKDSVNKSAKKFTPPTLEEVAKYINEQSFHINAEQFYDYYQANGWLVGRNKMKDWKATIRNWERREHKSTAPVSDNSLDDLLDCLFFFI